MEKAIVCFSGGHASALTAVEAVRKYGKDRVMLINHNISNHVEHQDIKRFKQDVSSYLDVPITYANAEDYEEMTPLAVMRKKGGNSARLVHCTMYLKIDPFHKWLKANYPATHKNPCNSVSILYGFDAKETERIYYRREMFKGLGYNTEYPLALWSRTISEIEDVGIKRPITYKIYKHANCIGCLKAGRQHWYCVYCLRPEIWEEAKHSERETGYSIINGTYLNELEPLFKEMRDEKQICPSEKMSHQAFWAKVEKIIPGEFSLIPCDCDI